MSQQPFVARSSRAVRTGASRMAVLALAALPALAVHAAVPEADLEAGVQLVQRASAGDGAAVDAADAHFTRLLATDPTDPLLRAYAGASHALKARDAWLPWKKLSYVEDGLAELDKALAMLTPTHDTGLLHRGVPVSLETRLVAANTFLGLPGMFNRKAAGDKLLDEVLKSPLLDRTPAPFRASVWARAAKAAHADGRVADEKHFLGLVATSGAPQAAAAQAALKDLP